MFNKKWPERKKWWDFINWKIIKLKSKINPAAGQNFYFWAGIILMLIGFGVFLKLAVELSEQELAAFDGAFTGILFSRRSPLATIFMRYITDLGSTVTVTIIPVLVTIIGLKRWRALDVLLYDLCLGGALGLSELLKYIFQRSRPLHPWLASAGGYSFPSGHALLSMTLYGFLAYLIIRNTQWSRWRKPAVSGLLLIPLLVGISRVYLGVHYPSDVLAGWSAAMAWVGSFIMFREYFVNGRKVKSEKRL